MRKPRVFATRRWPEAVEGRLHELFDVTENTADRPLDGAALAQAMKSHDALLPTVTDKINAEVIEAGSGTTRIIANYGVGFSHIDVEAAKSNGIAVTNTPDVLSECTADIAIMLMLMAARRAGEGERELRAGEWSGWRPTHLIGQKMSGKTLGIIGFGRIGRATARRAHFGFGMSVIVQNRSKVDAADLDAYGARQVDSVDELVAASDFVSLHCPGGEENKHLIDARRLSLMPSSGFLINTARGEVVDEDALADALASKAIAGAGLDVFDGEPNVNPRLLECENAVLLPHLGSATRETREAMGMRVIDNLIAFFDGKEPGDRVA